MGRNERFFIPWIFKPIKIPHFNSQFQITLDVLSLRRPFTRRWVRWWLIIGGYRISVRKTGHWSDAVSGYWRVNSSGVGKLLIGLSFFLYDSRWSEMLYQMTLAWLDFLKIVGPVVVYIEEMLGFSNAPLALSWSPVLQQGGVASQSLCEWSVFLFFGTDS